MCLGLCLWSLGLLAVTWSQKDPPQHRTAQTMYSYSPDRTQLLYSALWKAFTHDARTDQVAWKAALTKGVVLGVQWYLRV